ncbi:Glycosyl transferase family 2 [Pedobacter steynii]|uniref:Glycosyl transferase family 2 n=1 Tax=Pedobacter steynii TaxID=430522 RepID=A0A1G9RXK9_9SPHI|nr:glycosyltransferase [Pedobacter steynii]NQX37630.1 glycosyltransferase [Pedobacter steynii]SDM27225.1 Glycosyl transferase family 2 [Pedobacter steynii]
MNKQLPLVSCICITNNRPLLLQRALACFETQEYPNKELVISYPENDSVSRILINQISTISDINIVRLERAATEKLGTARNKAVVAANGDFICVWDDDDWYSNNRISHQYQVIKNSPFKASVCTNIIILHFKDKKICYSGSKLWEGTLFCDRAVLIRYPYLDKEKGEAETLIYQLAANNNLFPIINDPYLYVHIFHGENCLEENYFNIHLYNSLALEESTQKDIEELTSLDNYVL